MIVMKYSITEKQNLIMRYHAGESVTGICLQSGVPRSTFYSWLKPRKPSINGINENVSYLEHYKLKNQATRLESIIDVLKKVNCTATSPLKEKLAALEHLHGQYSVHVLCDALDVARGTFYNHIKRNLRENNGYKERRNKLSEQIMQVYNESNQIYGARKIKAVLTERGVVVSDKMVEELMREMNISSIRTGAKKFYNQLNYKKKNDILKMNFNVKAPNTVWASDITSFRINNKTYYIYVQFLIYTLVKLLLIRYLRRIVPA